MPFGRSLTYRFAATAAPWLGALTGHTPLTPGATRRLASGALRHFLDRGAVTADGLLPLGWYGPYAPMLQSYSGPASPYWAAKGFLGLLLPADDPAWTDPEAPLPAETADAAHPLGPTGLLLHSTASDGLVRLHNHGSNSTLAAPDPYYARFAYSTRTGPTAPTAVDRSLPDNHFALLIDGHPTTRGPATPRPPAPAGPLPSTHPVTPTAANSPASGSCPSPSSTAAPNSAPIWSPAPPPAPAYARRAGPPHPTAPPPNSTPSTATTPRPAGPRR